MELFRIISFLAILAFGLASGASLTTAHSEPVGMSVLASLNAEAPEHCAQSEAMPISQHHHNSCGDCLSCHSAGVGPIVDAPCDHHHMNRREVPRVGNWPAGRSVPPDFDPPKTLA